MCLPSKCRSNLMIWIFLFDSSILFMMCIGQTTSNLSMDSSIEDFNKTLVFVTTKYQQQIFTITTLPDVTPQSSLLIGNVTTVVSKRRTKQRRRKRGRRKGIVLSTEMTILQANEAGFTNHTAIDTPGRNKNKRRRRKFKKRRRKPKKSHNNILEITTAKGMRLPIETKSPFSEMIRKINENPEGNFDEYKRKIADKTLTLSSNGLFLANLVGPIPVSMENPNATTVLFKSGRQRESDNRQNRCRKHRCAHSCHPERKTKCSCLEGFYLAKDGRSCIDINECKIDNGGCAMKCTNTLGSYECRCPKGLRLSDDLKTCEDINECLLRNGHGPCQDTCVNTFGHYNCSCAGLNGTKLAADGESCEDLDECAKENGGCSHECINTLGRAFCSCPQGMELSHDWRTCQDIDECEDDVIKKTCENGCLNTIGSYHCLGMQNDQASVNIVCKPLFPPSRGFIRCSRNRAFQSFTRKGRKRIINSPGTVCELICPKKYKISRKYHVMCGLNGKWVGEKDGKCLERRYLL